jgi:DNA-binding HxlR family transcriptional regulator
MFRGKRRFSDFVNEFGVSRAVLTDRLSKLVEHGVLYRLAEKGAHPEYRLTPCGLDLWSLFLAMWIWETEWGTAKDPDTWAPDMPRAQVAHTVCGHAMQPRLCCTHCHQEVTAFDTVGVPSTAERWAGQEGGVVSSFRRARQPANVGDAANQVQTLSRIVGDRWNSAMVAAAFRGIRTFSRFEQELAIRPAQLSQRLAELLQLGILRTHVNQGGRQEYRLTKAGVALFPATLEMVRWGNRWMLEGDRPFRIQHLPCQHDLVAKWHCGHCQMPLERDTVHFS